MTQTSPQQTSTGVHNAIVLSFAQAFNGAIGPIAIALGAIAGEQLMASTPALATLPVAGYSVGAAMFALPVALLTKALGRRNGFMLGAIVGILGAGITSFALLTTQFWLFCAGFLLLGGSGAFVQQYRFAAADQGSDKFKARAISWVLTGGVLAAIIGPQTAILTKDLFPGTAHMGAFIAIAALLLVGFIILSFLRPIPPPQISATAAPEQIRPLPAIMKNPTFIVALLCAVSSYGLMAFMMTGAPYAMTHHHGFSETQAIEGIQWHVMAMFAPSFFTGLLIVKFGKPLVIGAGLCLLLLCSGVALAGLELWNFWTSLILLGIGWNFGFIGATALLGETYTPAEKNKVQGAHDFILFSFVAAGALLSGVTLNAFGWHGLAIVLLPVASFSLLALMWLTMSTRKQSA